MNTPLTPHACDPQAWKRWLRDGSRVSMRVLSGWGVLWMLFFVARAYVLRRYCWDNPWVEMLALGLAVGFEAAHASVAELAAQGRVGLGAQLKALTQTGLGSGVLWGQLLRHRMTYFVRFFLIVLALGSLLALVNPPTTVAPAVEAYGWRWWVQALRESAFLSLWPLLVRPHQMSCLSLPLLTRWGMSAQEAQRLDEAAHQKNRHALERLGWVGTLGAILGLMVPPLAPLVELWWAGVSTCAHNEVYGQGTGVQALARVRLRRAGWRPQAA